MINIFAKYKNKILYRKCIDYPYYIIPVNKIIKYESIIDNNNLNLDITIIQKNKFMEYIWVFLIQQ